MEREIEIQRERRAIFIVRKFNNNKKQLIQQLELINVSIELIVINNKKKAQCFLFSNK